MNARVVLLGLGMLLTAFAAAPMASAERITGCVDADGDTSDCVVGRYTPCDDPRQLFCIIICIRECGPPW